MDEMVSKRTIAFDLLDDTDGRINELESAVRMVAIGLKAATGDDLTEKALLHIANCLQDIQGQLDEAIAAALQAMKGVAA